MERAGRILRIAAGLVCLVAYVATAAWIVSTLFVRPLDGVEGDVLFEASRIRERFPLYVDPTVGAHEYGPVPARYYVLYPPLWSAILSRAPADAAPVLARVLAAAAWILLPAWILRRARPDCRAAASVAFAFVGSVWVLANFGTAGRPDALAVFSAGIALERVVRTSSERKAAFVDPVSGALLAIAVWIKPNVLGIAPGVFLGAILAARASRTSIAGAVARGLGAALGAGLVVLLVLAKLTDGEVMRHLFASTAQPPSLALWLDQVGHRGPFFVGAFGIAAFVGWRGRRDPGVTIGLAALATSCAWCTLSLAKTGSASNYFMEPSIAMLVVVARAPFRELGEQARALLSAVALAQALYTGVASVKSAREGMATARPLADAVRAARAKCTARASDVAIADEPGLEMMLDGRIVATPFQSTHLARAGRFPLDAWIADVMRPEIRCVVMQDDLLERPLEAVDVLHDRFPPELRRVLVARFVLTSEHAGLRVYERRRTPE